jgi:hypothetical protein
MCGATKESADFAQNPTGAFVEGVSPRRWRDVFSLLLGPHGHAMFLRPDGLTCPRAPTGANVVRQREPWADPMDTNRLLIIAAAIVLALVLVWYLLPRSTPTAPTATPPPATTPAQPQQ